LADFLRLPHILISYAGDIGAVDHALRAFGRYRTITASLTHFASAPLFLKEAAAIATLPSHAARILARASNLQTNSVPVDLGTFDAYVVARRDSVGDHGLAWLSEQIALCAEEALRVSPRRVNRSQSNVTPR